MYLGVKHGLFIVVVECNSRFAFAIIFFDIFKNKKIQCCTVIPESALMSFPAHRFSADRPNSTAKHMEKIAVTQGPTAFRLHLLQCPAQETASCGAGGLCEKLKGNFSCPANLTPLPRMNQNTLVERKERKRK